MLSCEECPTLKPIQAIGTELDNISNQRRINNGKEITVEVKPKVGRKPKIKITAEEYHEMRNKGMSDTTIARKLGVVRESLLRWRKRNKVDENKSILDAATEKEVGEFIWR